MSLGVATQAAVRGALLDSTELMARISGVFDFVQEEQDYPYVRIGGPEAVPFDTCEKAGQETTIQVDVWSEYRGKKEALEIQDIIHRILHRAPIQIAGADMILCRCTFATVLTDPDGVTQHGVQKFKILSQEE